VERKGGAGCPLHTRLEIDQAAFELWLLLALGETIARDANRRGTPLNRRRNVLPKIHEQYNAVAMRFARRCEGLELEKGGLDLARLAFRSARSCVNRTLSETRTIYPLDPFSPEAALLILFEVVEASARIVDESAGKQMMRNGSNRVEIVRYDRVNAARSTKKQ
jgi:hypothetical protein